MHTYTDMHITTFNEKGDDEFERDQGKVYWVFGGKKVKKETM